MKRILCLIIFLVMSLGVQAATVGISQGKPTDPQGYDPDRYLISAANPTVEEIANFKDGLYDLMRFTSTTPVLENATDDLNSCEQAITTVCTILEATPNECKVIPTNVCRGRCSSRIFIRIID